ncbi:MAG: ABC transporter permease [Lachnospiraceae bacterium]|nr:ABC transporter permease [Lachnospiraceae bacterium]
MTLKKFINRILQMLLVLLGISFLTFMLTYLAPGDPATAMFSAAGVTPKPEQLEAVRVSMGLDKPFFVQYMTWLTNCLHGDFGTSFSNKNLVLNQIMGRLGATVKLSFLSMGIMLIISIPLGVISAVKENKWCDNLIRVLNFMGISMPGFWLGLLLQYVFAINLKLLPVASQGMGLNKMILPSSTLAVAMTSKYTRQVRAAVLDELSMDYVVGAKARGLSNAQILFLHVLPNAMLPLITLLGISFGSLLGGTAVVEMIFSYPGLGELGIRAVRGRDYPLIQGFVLWIALIYMVINLIVDISYSLFDPRVREKRQS